MANDRFGKRCKRACRRFDKRFLKRIKRGVFWFKTVLLLWAGAMYVLGVGLLLYRDKKDRPVRSITLR